MTRASAFRTILISTAFALVACDKPNAAVEEVVVDMTAQLSALYFDIWRANRLVVDTGMHALGWTREESIEWMSSNSPITEVDVVTEVERYIGVPSQALAYKVDRWIESQQT